MDKQKLISTIKQEFMLKRCRAQEEADLFLEKSKANKKMYEYQLKYELKKDSVIKRSLLIIYLF